MIDFFNIILAAKDGKGRFEWLFPLAFFAFYIISAISKGKKQKEYDEKLDDKLDEIDKEPMPQAQETVYIKPPKEILQKQLRAKLSKAHDEKQERARAAQRQHLLRATEAKRKAEKLRTSAAHTYVRAESELEILPETPQSVIGNIHQPQTIRDAIVLAEIIGKPRSINQWDY